MVSDADCPMPPQRFVRNFAFQPQVFCSGEYRGAEALLRPADPDVIANDPMLAFEAITVARRHGLARGILAVNLEQAHVCDEVISAIAAVSTGAAFTVEVEITERGGTPPRSMVAAVSRTGLRVALDDVDLEHAPTALRSRPDTIKLTPAAIDDPVGLRRFCHAAARQRCTVIVEGIETSSQARIVFAAGADVGQGFLYSRAISARSLQRWRWNREHSVGSTSRP